MGRQRVPQRERPAAMDHSRCVASRRPQTKTVTMGQIRVLHEHYDRRPWAGIVAGVLVIIPIISQLIDDGFSVTSVIICALTAVPLLLILILDVIRRKRPSLVVYNDRIEVMIPSVSPKTDEIMYSDIRNLAMESGQLLIWRDDQSSPMYCNLGANVRNAQETYDILRSAYDKYNHEHNIKPVPVENLPKRNKGVMIAIMILVMIAVMMLMFLLRR